MKHGSLFSGIGGFDLASEWMGWENVFHCEWMEFPRKVLDYYWPNADSHIDICKTDFTKYANTIDILTGGFPCQPFSMAGKRKGTEDERYLWGEMLRAVQEIKPKYVIAENVFGITNIDGGLVFEQVCIDLEIEGYEVQPFIIPAASKNAPHRRDRCWFIAFKNTLHGGCLHGEHEQEGAEVRKFGNISTRSADGIYLSEGDVTDTEHKGLEGHNRQREGRSINRSDEGLFIGAKDKFISTNTHGNGFQQCNGNDEIEPSERRINAQRDIKQGDVNGNATNSDSCRQQTLNNKKRFLGQENRSETFSGNCSKSIYRKEGWENFPTQSPICGGDDGLPTELDGITFSKWRAESIKGYGNAIVPQVALELFKVIEKINCNLSK
jgi:DNA (cytosine-5)-methyltransferase 1